MAHELAGFITRGGEAQAIDHVVQPQFQQLHQVRTRNARPALRLREEAMELRLQHAVNAAGLLLLTQMHSEFRLFAAALAVLARRRRPPLDRTLLGQALLAFQEELDPLAPAHAAVWSDIACHVFLLVISG